MFYIYSVLFRETHRNEASADEERGEEAASIVQEGAEDWSEAETCSKCCVHQGVNQAGVAWETSKNILSLDHDWDENLYILSSTLQLEEITSQSRELLQPPPPACGGCKPEQGSCSCHQ